MTWRYVFLLQKLATVSLRIQQIETTLSILEAKVNEGPLPIQTRDRSGVLGGQWGKYMY